MLLMWIEQRKFPRQSEAQSQQLKRSTTGEKKMKDDLSLKWKKLWISNIWIFSLCVREHHITLLCAGEWTVFDAKSERGKIKSHYHFEALALHMMLPLPCCVLIKSLLMPFHSNLIGRPFGAFLTASHSIHFTSLRRVIGFIETRNEDKKEISSSIDFGGSLASTCFIHLFL